MVRFLKLLMIIYLRYIYETVSKDKYLIYSFRKLENTYSGNLKKARVDVNGNICNKECMMIN